MKQKGEMKTTEILAALLIVSLIFVNYFSYKIGWRKGSNAAFEAGEKIGRMKGRKESFDESYWKQCSGKGDIIRYDEKWKNLECVHPNGIQNTMIELEE